MSNRTGRKQTEKGRLCEQYIRETGADVAEYEKARVWVEKQGGGPLTEFMFFRYRRNIRDGLPPTARPEEDHPVTMTHEANGHEANGTAGPLAPLFLTAVPDDRPAPHEALDHLAKLVRFGAAVEAVGGIETAERLLGVLKQMRGVLR